MLTVSVYGHSKSHQPTNQHTQNIIILLTHSTIVDQGSIIIFSNSYLELNHTVWIRVHHSMVQFLSPGSAVRSALIVNFAPN